MIKHPGFCRRIVVFGSTAANHLVMFFLAALIAAGCRPSTTRGSDPSAPPAGQGGKASRPQEVGELAGDPVAGMLAHVRDLLDAGQVDSAVTVLGPAMLNAAQPLDPRLPRALVLTCNEAATPWEGAQILDELLRLRPDGVHVLVAKADLELARGRADVALRYAQRAIVADPQSPEAMGAFGRCRAVTGGSIENALTYFDKASKAKPLLPAPRYGKAALLLAADRVGEASDELNRIVTLGAGLWFAERDYGRALVRLENRAQAAEHFENAVRLLDAAGDPLMAERVAAELRSAAEVPAPNPSPAAPSR